MSSVTSLRVGNTQQQQQQQPMRPSGTPIVVGASPRAAARRRPSTAIAPAGSPAVPQRLASLSSPVGLSGARGAPQPAAGPQRDRTHATRLMSPSKRARAESSEPGPIPLPRLKTVTDYTLLPADEISSMTIEYFCRDSRHGRPTQEFIERENMALRRLHLPPGSEGGSRAPSKPASPVVEKAPESDPLEQPTSARMAAQVRVVNGKVIIDTDSLVVSRSDMAKDSGEPLELVDESERPRFINSLTYVTKRGSRRRWRPEETELFYQHLRKFGSDFEMISNAMPNRCRYDIRNKFKLEERKNPQRITDTLLRRRPQDVGSPLAPARQDGAQPLEDYSIAAGSAAGDGPAGDASVDADSMPES
ncbi:hypothetical protein LPJ61_001449 [Coemansia biformis]|uniref:Myb-like domain-containing protein n=1 Tax=Coemansia biformis TaxID=1286918 RepID=A0A9W8CY38_9FUNG|nr:hypothetical protein LPJ61_001449 [Coemansia biformis]